MTSGVCLVHCGIKDQSYVVESRWLRLDFQHGGVFGPPISKLDYESLRFRLGLEFSC